MYEPYAPRLIAPDPGPSHRSSPGQSIPSAAATDSVLRVLERIEQVVAQESLALKQHRGVDLKDFNQRKSHGLLELSRAMRTLNGAAGRAAIEPRLASLRDTLQRNGALLKMHIDAVGEISAVMAGAMREAESDGTYSGAARYGRGG